MGWIPSNSCEKPTTTNTTCQIGSLLILCWSYWYHSLNSASSPWLWHFFWTLVFASRLVFSKKICICPGADRSYTCWAAHLGLPTKSEALDNWYLGCLPQKSKTLRLALVQVAYLTSDPRKLHLGGWGRWPIKCVLLSQLPQQVIRVWQAVQTPQNCPHGGVRELGLLILYLPRVISWELLPGWLIIIPR